MKKLLIAAVIALVVAGTARVGSADGPDEHASCVGILSVFNTQNPEVFGTRADIAHTFKAVADTLGIPPGAIVVSFAQNQGGSVPGCL